MQTKAILKTEIKKTNKKETNSKFKQKNQLYLQYLEFTVNIALCTMEHLKIKYPIKTKMH